MKRTVLILSCTVLGLFSTAQTGPAGVGSTTSNCLWLKANAGTSSTVNATALSSWNDQSGNGNHVSQATANLQPLYTSNLINGFPAVQFDNVTTTNDKMSGADSPTLDNTTGYTFFMVSRPQVVDGAARVIVSKRTTVSVDQSFMQFYYTGNAFHTDIQTTNDRYNTNATFSANNNYLIDQLFDGTLASASRCKTYLAGTLDKTASESSTIVPDNASPLILGSTDGSDPRPFGGYIAEVIMYRKACNDPERIIVDNYLSAKYNIALTSNDKYTGDGAGLDYDFDVSGVGKDATGSSPSFSPSVSGGFGVSTTGVGFDNGDYLIAGHKVGTNLQMLFDVAGMTGTSNARWLRIWNVDVTNTAANIVADLEFDMSDGGVGPVTFGPVSNYVLIYRPGTTGSWTELATATSTVGDRILFSTFTFTNDGYYTIGTKNYLLSPLPIELMSFDAIKNDKRVDISWETASETLNDYFTVERSKDGITFETVAIVKGSSNSKTALQYSETDFNPLSGISYYRLKQTDINGKNSYSKTVAVNYHFGEEGITVFPNPSNGDFNINLQGLENKEVLVLLKDITGKECYSKVIVIQQNKEIIAVDMAGKLPPGTYLVMASSANLLFSQKIIIK